MDVKEKLVELKRILRECLHFNYDEFSCEMSLDVDLTAENLIAHGVTVQEWFSVNDPPKKKGCYLIAGNHWWDGKPVAREAYWNGDDWLSCYDKANISRRVTHWRYLPQPPTEE